MREPVIHQDVAVGLLRMLSGAPGYPFHPEGEMRAASVLCGCCVSVEHVRRVIEEFEADFPTLEQIRAVAFRLREEFEPKTPDPAMEKPGTFDPTWPACVVDQMKREMDEHWEKDNEMWAAIKKRLGISTFNKVPSLKIYQAKLELGYTLTRGEQEIWDRAHPPKTSS